MSETAITKHVGVGESGVELRNVDDLLSFASYVVKSGLAPAGLNTPEKVAIAIETGLEAGMKPMMALRVIAVINGRAAWMGDGALALVRSRGALEWIKEGMSGEGDDKHAWVQTKRVGTTEPLTTRFSVLDAKRAGLWGKPGPWQQYPQRQLRYRALGFNMRDQFSDILLGMPLAEEAADMPLAEVKISALPTLATPDPAMVALEKPIDAEFGEPKPKPRTRRAAATAAAQPEQAAPTPDPLTEFMDGPGEMPPLTEEGEAPLLKDTPLTPAEQIVLTFAEKHDLTNERAVARLDAYCVNLFRGKKLADLKDAKSLDGIMERVKSGEIIP